MKKINRILIAFILASGFFLISLPSLFAQEDVTEEFTLDEITVTAQKREEDQQKVPIAMVVVTGDEMKELGQKDIDQILSSIGTIVFMKSGDGYRVDLRGINDDNGLFAGGIHMSQPSVAISTDGVYSSRSDAGQGLYDLERVEVLFGPQSTMYANTSPGGIINVITAAPKTDKYEVSGTVEYGNYNYLRTEGVMNAPLSDKMALRTAFSTSVRDGYISNGSDDEDNKSARVKLLYQPDDRFSFTLTGDYAFDGGHGFANASLFTNQSDVDDPWTSEQELGDPNNMKKKSISGNITWDAGIGTLTVIPAYSTNKTSSTQTREDPMTGVTSTQKGKMNMNEKSADARMVSSDESPVKWILGANYNYGASVNEQVTVGTAYEGLNDISDKSHAFYGNITYPVTDLFRVNGGARKSWDRAWIYGYQKNATAGTIPTDSGTITTNPDGTMNVVNDYGQEYSNWDYKIGMEYDLSSNSMLYADWSSSYRMQAMGRQAPSGETPPPEQLGAYTIGAKNRFFNNKLQLNVAAFYNDYQNKMIQGDPLVAQAFYEDDTRFIEAGYTAVDGTEGLDINGDGTITHEASYLYATRDIVGFWGDFRSAGIDVTGSWIITNRDKLDFSVSYLDSVWTNLIFEFPYSEVYPSVDYNGKPNILAPKYSFTLSYSHNFMLWNGATLVPRFDTRFQSSYYLSYVEQTAINQQEAYHLDNFSLIYTNPDGKWTFTGYVKNIWNYAVKLGGGGGGGPAGGGGGFMLNSPRTFGGILSMRF